MMELKHFTDLDISDDEIRIIGFDDNEPQEDKDSDDDSEKDSEADYDISFYETESAMIHRFFMPTVPPQTDESARNHSRKLLDKSRRLKIKFRYAVIIFSVLTLALIIAVGTLIYSLNYNKNLYFEADGSFETIACYGADADITDATPLSVIRENREHAADSASFVEITDMTVNDVAMKLYIPHNGKMSLHLGPIDWDDTSIIYAAQAADVRADNGGIVGAFVVDGEPKAWGLSKKGYVASINGEVTIGVADNSPLFEKATECGGHFFRQYPLVCDGQMVPNKVRGKSIRRGICERNGEIFMVETINKESFHDFSLALVDLGVDQAVYLVGSTAAGWAVDANDSIHTFGDRYNDPKTMPENISYIVWRR